MLSDEIASMRIKIIGLYVFLILMVATMWDLLTPSWWPQVGVPDWAYAPMGAAMGAFVVWDWKRF